MDRNSFVGVGRIGKSIASELVCKGFDLIVHDVHAEINAIIAMLPNSAIVAAVLAGGGG